MGRIQDLRNELKEFRKTPAGVAHDLRMNFADVVFRHLASRKLTQGQLAKMAGLKAPYVTRVVHSSQNWTTETAGRILCALGLHLELIETPISEQHLHTSTYSRNTEGIINGQEEIQGVSADCYQANAGRRSVICKIGPTNGSQEYRLAEVAACSQ